jgi:hypothetical protein
MRNLRHRWIILMTSLIIGFSLMLAACGSITVGSKPASHPTLTPSIVMPTATSTHPAGSVITVPIVSVTMFTATTGWGTVKSHSGSDDH